MVGWNQVHGKGPVWGKVQGQLKIRVRHGQNQDEGHFKARRCQGQCEVQEDLQDHDEIKKLIIKVKFHIQGQIGGKIMGL